MKIEKILSTEPVIVDFYCDELFQFEDIINYIYLQPAIRQNYGDLIVNEKRFVIPANNVFAEKLYKNLSNQILELCKEIVKMDTTRYPIQDDKIFSLKKIGLDAYLDEAGFSMPWHLDNRLLIVSGIINLDENETNTLFSTKEEWWMDEGKDTRNNTIHAVGQSKKYYGTAWLNSEKTWHCVPRVEKSRKILLFNLYF